MKKKLVAGILGGTLAALGAAGTVNAEELVEVVWQWPSTGTIGSGFEAVEDALNEMLEKDIGVHVTLMPAEFANLENETVLTVSSGEQLDLCLSVGTGVGNLVSSGLIEPLDEYLDEYGSAIAEKCGSALAGGYYDGTLYGLPNAYIQGESYGYLMRTDLIEKYGLEIDENKLYTLDELEEMFAIVKEGEGDNFFCLIPSPTSENPLARSAFAFDKLGSTTASGILLFRDDDFTGLTIENMYETDEYASYAQRMYDWAQKGYISKDAATNTESESTLLASGSYLGEFYWSTPGSEETTEAESGCELTTIHIIDGYTAGDRFQNILWSVPITSENPAKAVEALNYIYEHDEAAWLLQYGLEGQTYEVVEKTEEGMKIKYLSDDPFTLPYYQPYGVYGDRLAWPVMDPNTIDMNSIIREFSDSIPESRKSSALGYCFNRDSVSTEFSTVTSVIAQYVPSINCGTADPETNLAEFRQALKDAGIETIIAENQRQLDEWAAAQ